MSEQDQPISLEDRKAECKPLVLIISDGPEYSRLFRLLADKLGVTVHIVASCDEAVRALKKFAFDIVVMDWQMTENCAMCIAKIRELERNGGNHVSVIGITGHVRVNLNGCLAAGLDDYLPMPFTFEQLHNKLCYWLNQKVE